MPTSVYHNQISQTNEQNLIEDLVMEVIKIHGVDMYYLPRSEFNKDPIYTEDVASKFKNAYLIEMYVKTFEGFRGRGDIFNAMGMSIQDEMTLTVSRRRFTEEIGTALGIIRPREGDLIYLPLNQAIFEIKFVEHEASFYQVGGLYFYELTCHKFEYSSERFETGNPDLDELVVPYSQDSLVTAGELSTEDGLVLLSERGDILFTEIDVGQEANIFQNKDFQQASDSGLIDFTESNPFGDKI